MRPATVLVLALLLLLPASLEGQRAQWTPTQGFFDHDRRMWAPDKAEHAGAGAVLDLVARGPWITKSWRDRPWKRVAIVAVIGAAYEITDWRRAVSGGRVGFGALDLAADVVGAVLAEFVVRMLQ